MSYYSKKNQQGFAPQSWYEDPAADEVDPPCVNMAYTCPFCDGMGGEEDADEDGLCWAKCYECDGNGGWDSMTPVWNNIKACSKTIKQLQKAQPVNMYVMKIAHIKKISNQLWEIVNQWKAEKKKEKLSKTV